MALPRTRSNRAGILAMQKLISSGIAVNTRGFPALPNELYLEILSYLPTVPIHGVWADKKPDPCRQLTLYYLSQTCQSLRKFFLRFAWERIEVFGGMWTPTGRLASKVERNKRGIMRRELIDKKMVGEILRQFETVIIRNPDLRQYVSIVNLTILGYFHDSVIPEIAQHLSLFPNLHSIQFIFRINYRSLRRNIFSEYRYLNVHTLNLNGMSPYRDILQACPNTRHFFLYKDIVPMPQLQELFAHACFGNIEKFGILSSASLPANIVEGLPGLRDLSLDCRRGLGTSLETLKKCLTSLPLHTLRVRWDDWSHYSKTSVITPDHERQTWIRLLKEVLAQCPRHDVPKKVIVVNVDETVKEYAV